LNEKSHIDQICKLASLYSEFNFDMLKALVEEMNRYNESPQDAMRLLNAKPEFDNEQSFTVKLEASGQVFDANHDTSVFSPVVWISNPLNKPICIEYDAEPDNEDAAWLDARFTPGDLKQMNPESGTFVFVNGKGEKVTLVRRRETKFNYWDAF
jgi:hypothetical protein